MSDPQTWPSLANGDASGVHESPPPPNPHPSDIKDESWGRAEEATGEVLRCIRPTVVSEERRKAVVDYVQLLLRTRTSTAVFPFGSVPLKTYLPDGDIDLTTLGLPSNEDNLASEVCSVLGEEEQNSDAEFEVKDVQLIRAEVKLVKCIVQNIVVDISFNQIGGLCTLCFLEKVDQKIGNDHLVKRSIILIKAWCYYESRILGAHHGLISTYALEILVLYVFHLFHDYLDGPLAVLYRFLDYYSKFDWDKYCISLQGPISISSLPNLVVEPLETNGSCSLLTEEFIKECVDKFSVPSRVYGNNYQVFAQKHLNIVDPLKRNNNLGRSVSKGNFYRIRSAFTYGARKLGRILLLPSESIADEINLFFKSTLDRHGSGDRPDVQDAASSCPKTRNDVTIDHNVMGSSSNLNAEDGHEDSQFSGSLAGGSNGILVDDINNIKISDMGQENTSKKHDKHSFSTFVANRLDDCSKIDSIIPEEEFPESAKDDARDFALERAFDSRSLGDNFKASTSGKAHHDPHFFFHLENVSEDDKNGNSSSVDSGTVSVPSRSSITPLEEIRYDSKSSSSTSLRKSALIAPASAINEPSPSSGNSYLSEHSSFHECSNDGNLNNASATCTNLSDLSGDYSLYCRNLEHSREFQECVSSPYLAPVYQTSQFQNKQSWSMPNIYSHVGVNGLVHMPPFPPSCYLLQPVIPNDYGTKDITKTRGTGTYLPNTNSRSYKERQPAGRVKNQIHTNTNQFPRYRKNGYGDSPNHGVSSEERNHGPSLQPQIPISVENGHDKLIPSDVPQPSAAFVILSPKNGFPYPSSGKLEFGSLGPVAVGVSSPGRGRNFESPNVVGRGPAPVIPESAVEKPHKSWNHEREEEAVCLVQVLEKRVTNEVLQKGRVVANV